MPPRRHDTTPPRHHACSCWLSDGSPTYPGETARHRYLPVRDLQRQRRHPSSHHSRVRAVLVRVILDESNYHAVQVEEEEDEMEAELGEGFLRRCQQLDFATSGAGPCRPHTDCGAVVGGRTFLWTFSFRKISVASRRWALSAILQSSQVSFQTSLGVAAGHHERQRTSCRSTRGAAGSGAAAPSTR